MKVNGLSMKTLALEGQEPGLAMQAFATWVTKVTVEGSRPVFVGLNAPFDWSFINYYFHRFHKSNPFGFSALDIKAMYMGATGCTWSQTAGAKMAKQFRLTHLPTHNALDDARHQAKLFNMVRLKGQ
jgi:ribonuclease T